MLSSVLRSQRAIDVNIAIMRTFVQLRRMLASHDALARKLAPEKDLPLVTGVVAASHLGARYETLLAIHILSVALLLIWLPFGKLMHFFLVFVTRSQTGAQLSHRGAQQ